MIVAVASYLWTTLKMIWVVSASVGVTISMILVYMAVTDVRLLKKQHINSWRQYVANTSTIIFFGGLVGQSVYLFLGAVSLTQPNPPPHIKIPLINWIELGTFIFAVWFMMCCAVVIFYRRRKIIEQIEATIRDEIETSIMLKTKQDVTESGR